jgi:excisionase family DNA binding protein
MMETIYSINEICKKLGVARRTIHHWIATKQLRAFHLGGKRLTRVWEKDLLRFVRGRAKSRKR